MAASLINWDTYYVTTCAYFAEFSGMASKDLPCFRCGSGSAPTCLPDQVLARVNTQCKCYASCPEGFYLNDYTSVFCRGNPRSSLCHDFSLCENGVLIRYLLCILSFFFSFL